eukprot:6043312-Amphidinium_carterae.1
MSPSTDGILKYSSTRGQSLVRPDAQNQVTQPLDASHFCHTMCSRTGLCDGKDYMRNRDSTSYQNSLLEMVLYYLSGNR